EAGRIMAEEGVEDYQRAKLKAAQRLGVPQTRHLPRNEEIEAARREHLRLFRGRAQPAQLRRLREAALEAMAFLAPFRPRLVGPVLEGTADRHSEVTLHLFAGAAEEVAVHLMDHGIPYEALDRRLAMPDGRELRLPAFRVRRGEVPFLLVVFPPEGLRAAPRSALDGRPMARASAARLRALLEEEPEAGPSPFSP
ncbi:MAG: hypothetical protein D6809_04385, partial [Gammaproteobacteria bacterium]